MLLANVKIYIKFLDKDCPFKRDIIYGKKYQLYQY